MSFSKLRKREGKTPEAMCHRLKKILRRVRVKVQEREAFSRVLRTGFYF
jgi:hypothetical protein